MGKTSLIMGMFFIKNNWLALVSAGFFRPSTSRINPRKKIDCYANVSPPKSTDKEMFSSQFKSWCRKFAGFFTWMIVLFAR